MPKESFYNEEDLNAFNMQEINAAELNDRGLHVNWGQQQPRVSVGNVDLEWPGINRLIKTLRKARDQRYGEPE